MIEVPLYLLCYVSAALAGCCRMDSISTSCSCIDDLRGIKSPSGPSWRTRDVQTCSGSEAGSYLRLIDSCIAQLQAQGPCRTCNESKEEEEYFERNEAALRIMT